MKEADVTLDILTMRELSIGNKMFTKSLGGLEMWTLDWASRTDSQDTTELIHQGSYHL